MNRQIYNEQDLPMADLQKIGLAKNGLPNLDEDDLKALLSGRRTDMLRLENLTAEGVHIPALDAKLSLRENGSGKLELLLHPIYREVEIPDYLTEDEAEKLENGEVTNISKFIVDKEGKSKDIIVEFDPDTNEFLVTDSSRVLSPEAINGIPMTAAQKEEYRKGKEVKVADGTALQYSAKEKQGIRSNRLHLIASLLIDGGVSYVLFKGLHALLVKDEANPIAKEESTEYKAAFKKLSEQVKNGSIKIEPAEETGISR